MLVHHRVTPEHLICWYPFIHLGGECENKVSCTRTQHSGPGQGLNLACSIWRQCTNHEVTKVNCYCIVNISDVLTYLKTCLPADGYCIIGLTWVDLYPGEEWNFVLGESSCVDGCAVMSFGHFEPQSYEKRQLYVTDSPHHSDDVPPLSEGFQCGKNSTLSSLPENKNSQDEFRLYLEDFADIQTVGKQMIWRLLRVRSHVCWFWCECLLLCFSITCGL